jgi:hypothetical protein
MSKKNSFGKPLKRSFTNDLRSFSSISVGNLSASSISLPFLNGNVLTGVEIDDSIISNTVIGSPTPSTAFFTTLQTGVDGSGYNVVFYGSTAGDYVSWNPITSLFTINGDTYIRDALTVGNLRIIDNTLTAVNTNGDVILQPNGTGVINFSGKMYQNSTVDNSLTTTGTTSISSSTLNLTSSSGNINLTPSANIFIPDTKYLYFGSNSIRSVSNDMNITTSGKLNLSPTSSVNIQDTIPLQFGTTGSISSSTTTLNLQNTNLQLNGRVSSSKSIITIGQNLLDGKDRGTEFIRNDGVAQELLFSGFKGDVFTVYKDATNTSDVITGTLADINANTLYGVEVISDTITGDPDLFLVATRDIYLNAGRYIYVQANKEFFVGSSHLIYDTQLNINSSTNVKFNPTSGFITVPDSKKLSLSTLNTTYLSYDGSITEFTSPSSFRFNISGGSIFIPENRPLVFGTSTQYIINSGSELTITANSHINLSSAIGHVFIPANQKIAFGNQNDYILGQNSLILSTSGTGSFSSSGTLTLSSSASNIVLNSAQDISLTATNEIYIPVNVDVHYGNNLITGTATDLTITPVDNINLSADTNVNIPLNTVMAFSSAHTIQGITGELKITSTDDINITADNIFINGNLDVAGSLTYIDTVVTTITDPVIVLGSDTVDFLDRGISYLYNNGTAKKGFFGLNKLSGRWTFIKDAAEAVANIFTGTKGDIDVDNVYANSAIISSLTGLSTITGNPDLTLTATNLYLSGQANHFLSNKPVYFGGTTVYLQGDNNDMYFNSNTYTFNASVSALLNIPVINIPVASVINIGAHSISADINTLTITGNTELVLNSSSIFIPVSSYLYIGNTSLRETALNFTIEANNLPIYFNTNDAIHIESGTELFFGSTVNAVFDGTNLVITSPNSVNISNNLDVVGNITSATWTGDVIATLYGGTGKSSWTQGSVVFAGTSGTALSENNSNFYWDNTNSRLGLGVSAPLHKLHVLGGNIVIEDATAGGLLYRNDTTNNYNARVYTASVSYDYIIATGSDGNHLNLLEIFRARVDGKVGIGYTEVTRNSITELFSVNGNVLVKDTLKFNNNNYLNVSGTNLQLVSGNDINLNATSSVNVPLNIPVELGGAGNTITGTTGNISVVSTDINLNATSSVNIPLSIPLELGGSSNTITGTTGNISVVSTDINLNATSSVNVPLNIPVELGGAGNTITGTSGNINVVSTDINLNATSRVNIPANILLEMGTNSTIYSNATDLILTSTADILLSPISGIVIQEDIPLEFGTPVIGYIIGNSITNELEIYGNTHFPNNVIVGGNLTVSGTLTSVSSSTLVSDAHIFQLGGGSNFTITASSSTGTHVTLTLSPSPHYLVAGDIVNITNNTDIPDGAYTLSSSTTSTITFASVLTVTAINGEVKTIHTSDLNKDIGIQANWHAPSPNGVSAAKYSFFGFKKSSARWTFLNSNNPASAGDIFTGTLGDAELNALYVDNIRSAISGSILFSNNTSFGSNSVSGTNLAFTGGTLSNITITSSTGTFTTLTSANVVITGGTLNGVTLGNITPVVGTFSSFAITSTSLITNLNAEMLNGKLETAFLLANGTRPLSANWDAGNFTITIDNLILDAQTANKVVYTNASKQLSTTSGFSYDDGTNTLTATNIGSFNSTGSISNINVVSGSISDTDITLGVGQTFDATGGTVIFSAGQVNATSLYGTGNIDITGNSATVTNGIYKTTYTANSILKADVANNPVPLTVTEDTIVGRKLGGVIESLSPADGRAILGVEILNETNISNAGGIVQSGGTMTGLLNFSADRQTISGTSNVNIATTKNISYISITGTGMAYGSLTDGVIDGQWKTIIFSSIASGASYKLEFLIDKLITPDGDNSAKNMLFTLSGQSINLIWDNITTRWNIIPAGITSFI